MNPAHTPGLAWSKSTFQPYSPVAAAMNTLAHPSVSLTSVCRCICLNRSGCERYCKRVQSASCTWPGE